MLLIKEPTLVCFQDYPEDQGDKLSRHLKYTNRSIDFELRKLKKSGHQWGFSEKWEKRIEELEAKRNGNLLLKDENGYYTYSGLTKKLAYLLNDQFTNLISYPNSNTLPWHTIDSRSPYPYQLEAEDKLLQVKHGAVEIATGLGKSKIILDIVKKLGLKTIILTPSESIAKQLLTEFTTYLGKKYVGQYFGGKKEPKKLIVISIINSLTLIEPDSQHWRLIKDSQVLISDEAHTLGAETFSKVCLELLKKVPYRFFFSATQIRQDGLQLLLDGIIGEVVYSKTLKEGVDEGYLAKPIFTLIQTTSSNTCSSQDAQRMTREHLFYNPNIHKIVGNLVNNFCERNKPVLILTKEIEQFSKLLPYINYPVGYAHGALTKENIKTVPPQYQDQDPNELVKEFNKKAFPVLIGTSCIATGTDLKANQVTINLTGGTSEVSVRQGAIGRSTRLYPGKTTCQIIDFDVTNIDMVHRHAQLRKAIYNQEYPTVREVSYG